MTSESAAEFRGYRVQTRRLEVCGRHFRFIGPCEYEALLESPDVKARFAQDEYLPYWAEFWPASLLLIDAIAAWGPAENQAQVPLILELGCGLGPLSIVLASQGYPVIASDYDEDALAFARENARLNGLAGLDTRLIDWRLKYPDLRPDRIVAAEVLYERRNLDPVAAFIRHHLDPQGFAIICDRNRPTAADFPSVAHAAGLAVQVLVAERPGAPGEPPIRGRLYQLTLQK